MDNTIEEKQRIMTLMPIQCWQLIAPEQIHNTKTPIVKQPAFVIRSAAEHWDNEVLGPRVAVCYSTEIGVTHSPNLFIQKL